ncbi:MAG: hypothetical protein J5613_01275, partial [Alphaproteobacteria bacterium]|nr:hypothetical protein [Alphaproteobacteria bacterium]
MAYAETYIINRLEQDTTPTNVWQLYKRAYVKNIGKTSDTKKPYTEVISKWLLKRGHLKKLDNIQEVYRDIAQPYDMRHKVNNKEQLRKSKAKNNEKIIAKLMFDDNYDIIGHMCDFQTPLKGSEKDSGVGEIDLFSYNKKTNTVYLLELKREDNKESILRCVLEIYTYWKQLMHNKFLKDFNLPSNAKIVPAVLVFQDGKQHQQFKSDLTETKKLMKKL